MTVTKKFLPADNPRRWVPRHEVMFDSIKIVNVNIPFLE
jgi:hypothetical protein